MTDEFIRVQFQPAPLPGLSPPRTLAGARIGCGWLGGLLGLVLAVWLALGYAPKRRQTA